MMNSKNKKNSARVLSVLLTIVMVLGIFPMSAMAYDDWFTWDGEYSQYEPEVYDPSIEPILPAMQEIAPFSGAPTEIATWGQLNNFLSGTGAANGHFVLTANINVPMGGTAGRPGIFTGTFDGNGHTINGLNIGAMGDFVGMFQLLGPGAVIENLTFENSIFHASEGRWNGVTVPRVASSFGFIAGGIFPGAAPATIRNVTVNNVSTSVRATGTAAVITDRLRDTRTGGLVGSVSTGANLVVENSVVNAVMDGGSHVGGVVGWTAPGSNVRIIDTVVGPAVYGIEDNPPLPIQIRSTVAGDVGGFIGWSAGEVRLERVTNNANIDMRFHGINLAVAQGVANLGGLVGRSTGGLDIRDGTNHGNINHEPNAIQRSGGLVGWSVGRIEIGGGLNTGHLSSPGTNRDVANRMGGIVGQASHAAATGNRRIIIHNVENRGNILRPVHTSGGIVGHITGGTSGDITQVTNAVNHGHIRTRQNGGGIVGWVATPGTFVGGLRAGILLPGGTVGLNITQAGIQTRGSLNYGMVENMLDNQSGTAARRNGSVGGIIGNLTGADSVVHQAGNYGRVRGIHRGTGSGASSRGGQGGIIGRQAGARVLIQQVFNLGHISSADTSVMTGGIIGHLRAGGTLEDFYMAGTVSGDGARTRESGIIGQRTSGTMAIRRGYVATRVSHTDGTVNNATNRALNAGRGVMLGHSGTGANPAIAGMNFSQVYVLNTVGLPGTATGAAQFGPTATNSAYHRNVLQNHRGAILIGADMLAMGVLPGISGGPWRSGIVYEGTQDFVENKSTFPYFAWQTAHMEFGLQTPFFYQIRPSNVTIDCDPEDDLSHLFGTVAVGGQAEFRVGGIRFPSATRVFNPQQSPPAHNAANVSGRPIVGSVQHYETVGSTNVMGGTAMGSRVTFGLISPAGVISFGVAADSDFFIVQAIDADCPNRSVIDHARILMSPVITPALATDGITISPKGEVVPYTHWVRAEALGYHATDEIIITQLDLDIGSMQIEMRRAPINREIRVIVRDASHIVTTGTGTGDAFEYHPQPNLFNARGQTYPVGDAQANSTRFIHYERLEVPHTQEIPGDNPPIFTPEWGTPYTYRSDEFGGLPIGPGERRVVGVQGTNTRLALIPAGETMVGQRMLAGSGGFDWEDFNFCVSMIERNDAGVVPPTGVLTMVIYLDDAKLTSPVPVRVVEHLGYDEDTGDPIFVNVPNVTFTAEHSGNRLPSVAGDPFVGNRGAAPAEAFPLHNALMCTILTVSAPLFITRVVEAGTYYEPFQPAEDEAPEVPASMMIILEREVIFDAIVAEYVMLPNGATILRPIGGSYLYWRGNALPGSGDPDNRGLFLNVSTAAGDVITAAAVDFYFEENTHTVTREDHERTMESGDPVVITLTRMTPPRGTIRGFVWNAYTNVDTIPGATVMLLRADGEDFVYVESTTANSFGFFTFSDLDDGTYRIIARAGGFLANIAAVDPIVIEGYEGVIADVYLTPSIEDEPYILMVDAISAVRGMPVDAETTTIIFNGVELKHNGEIWTTTMAAAQDGVVRVDSQGYRLGVAYVTAESFGAFQFRFVRVILLPQDTGGPEFGGIYGDVRYGSDARFYPNAVVVIVPAGGGESIVTTTDAYGRYEVVGIEPGEYTVSVLAPGFAAVTSDVLTVYADRMTRQDFMLTDLDPDAGEYVMIVTVIGCPGADQTTVALNREEFGVAQTEILLAHLAGNVWIFREDSMFGEDPAYPYAISIVEARAHGYATDSMNVLPEHYAALESGGALANISLLLVEAAHFIRFHFDGTWVDVDVELDRLIDTALIPVPETRYGELGGIPGQLLMGWFAIQNPIHALASPNRAVAFDFNQLITEERLNAIMDEEGIANLYASWLEYGDLDGDGRVRMIDFNLLQRFIIGDESVIEDVHFIYDLADVDVNGRVNMVDLNLLQRFMLGDYYAIIGPRRAATPTP